MNKILDQIQAISEEAQRALSDSDLPRESLISGLSVCALESMGFDCLSFHIFFLRI